MSEIDEHARRVGELMAEIEAAETVARERVFELVEHVDHLHRTCVWRLFERLTELGGKGLVERLVEEPEVRTLFMLYDLIPADPITPLEADAPVSPPQSGGFVPLGGLRKKRAWRVVFSRDDLPPGALAAVEVDGEPVLLCGLDDGVAAYGNLCPGSALPLHLGGIANGEIRCPWHGCRFSAATGERIEGRGPDLEPFATEVRDGRIYVASDPSPPPGAARGERPDAQEGGPPEDTERNLP